MSRKDPELRRQYQQNYVSHNKERISAQKKKYRLVNADKLRETRRLKRLESPLINVREAVKLALRRKGGDITSEYVMGLWISQKGLCSLSGIPMTWGSNGNITTPPTSFSIDRVDQTIGYFVGNVRLVCHAVNSFRGSMTDQEMLYFAKNLVNNMTACNKAVEIVKEYV